MAVIQTNNTFLLSTVFRGNYFAITLVIVHLCQCAYVGGLHRTGTDRRLRIVCKNFIVPV